MKFTGFSIRLPFCNADLIFPVITLMLSLLLGGVAPAADTSR